MCEKRTCYFSKPCAYCTGGCDRSAPCTHAQCAIHVARTNHAAGYRLQCLPQLVQKLPMLANTSTRRDIAIRVSGSRHGLITQLTDMHTAACRFRGLTAWRVALRASIMGHASSQQKQKSTPPCQVGQLARVQHGWKLIGVSSAAAMYTTHECMWSATQKQAAIALSVCASAILTLDFGEFHKILNIRTRPQAKLTPCAGRPLLCGRWVSQPINPPISTAACSCSHVGHVGCSDVVSWECT